MTRVIIGIHGLANKPPRQEHRDGWIAAIKEGLKHLNLTPFLTPKPSLSTCTGPI